MYRVLRSTSEHNAAMRAQYQQQPIGTEAAAAAAWGLLAVLGFFVWDGALVASAVLTMFSCCVRIIVEISGTFEEPRARRKERRRQREESRPAAS